MAGLDRCAPAVSGDSFSCRLAELAAGCALGPQLCAGEFISHFARRRSVSRFSFPTRAADILNSSNTDQTRRARLLAHDSLLRDHGWSRHCADVANPSDSVASDDGPRTIARVSHKRTFDCAGNLLRLSASFLRS